MAVARFFHTLLLIFRGEIQECDDQSRQLMSVSAANGLSLWLAAGVITQGKVQFDLGKRDDGLDELRRGIKDWEHTGAQLVMPFWQWLLAGALSSTGEAEEASQSIEDALDRAVSSGERWWLPEIYCFRAQLDRDAGNTSPAIKQLEAALAAARESGAVVLGLKVATELFKFNPAAGRGPLTEWLAMIDAASTESGPATEQARRLLASP